MDENDNHPPAPSEDELREQLRQGLIEAAAGRTVPVAVVLAELDAAIARMEAARTDVA